MTIGDVRSPPAEVIRGLETSGGFRPCGGRQRERGSSGPDPEHPGATIGVAHPSTSSFPPGQEEKVVLLGKHRPCLLLSPMLDVGAAEKLTT